MTQNHKDIDPQETQEWLESIDDTLEEHGYERARFLLEELIDYAQAKGARLPFNTNTPFINTIQPVDEPDYPGDKEIERKIKSIIRWNAMAMVVRANTNTPILPSTILLSTLSNWGTGTLPVQYCTCLAESLWAGLRALRARAPRAQGLWGA